MARLIDADALEKMAIPCVIHNGALTELCVPLYQIRNASTLPNPCGNPCNFTKPIGEWLSPYSVDIANECSICHIKLPVIKEFYHYCPNCGAKMEDI